jgi:hypothetical protein
MDSIPFIASSNGPPWLPAAAAEARKFAYWGQIVALIFFVLMLLWGFVTLITLSVFGLEIFWGVFYIVIAIVDILILWLLKTTVFDAIDQGRFKEASDRLIIWGILGIILGGVIVGLLLLLAWIKLQEVFQVPYQQYQPQPYYQAPPQQPPQQYQQPQQYQAPPQYQQQAPPPQYQQAPPAPVPPAQETHKADMVKCKNCGVQYPAFMRNCPNCGAPR